MMTISGRPFANDWNISGLNEKMVVFPSWGWETRFRGTCALGTGVTKESISKKFTFRLIASII